MRLITSVELGLLKEIVPNYVDVVRMSMLVLLLCRRRKSPPSLLFAGSRLPAVQRLDLSSCADSSGGFGSDNNSSSIPGRSARMSH